MLLDILNYLLSFENVNELKFEIKKLIWVDVKGSKLGKRIWFKKDNFIFIFLEYIKKLNKCIEVFLRSFKILFDVSNDIIDIKCYEMKEIILEKYIELIRI